MSRRPDPDISAIELKRAGAFGDKLGRQVVAQVLASTRSEAAGPSYSVRRLAESLAERDIDVHLVSVGEAMTRRTATLTERRFPQSAKTWPLLRHLHMSRELQHWLSDPSNGVSVLHVHGLWLMPNVYPGIVARRRGLSLVHAPRGMLAPEALKFSSRKKRLFATLVQNRALAAVTCWHATSLKEVEDIRAFGLSAPVALIPNGIDVSDVADVSPSTPLPMDSSGKDTVRRTVLYLGRLHRIKRLDSLLEAWSRLEQRYPQWHLRIVGPSEGRYGNELRAQAQSLELSRVSFHDGLYGDDKERAYRDADVFVLPTSTENFGMVVAESLASGTPVICTRGAPWEGLQTHGCGWWIDHGAEPLAAALSDAMAMPREALNGMGEKGRAWMIRDFSWARIAADMETLYRWCATKGEPPPFVHFA